MRYGQIIRDGQTGDGLIASEGKKFIFDLEKHWTSENAPKIDMRVTLEFAPSGQLQAVHEGHIANTMPVGKILRDGQLGTGLVSCNGTKYPFTLEKEWMSDDPPSLGMSVHLQLNEHAQLQALYMAERPGLRLSTLHLGPVKGVFDQLVQNAPGHLNQLGKSSVVERLGSNRIIFFVVMLIAWNVLTVTNFRQTGGFSMLNLASLTSNPSMANAADGSQTFGFYNLVAWLSLFAIFLPAVWNDARARWSAFAPLAAMLVIVGVFSYKLYGLTKELLGIFNGLGVAQPQGGQSFWQNMMGGAMSRPSSAPVRAEVGFWDVLGEMLKNAEWGLYACLILGLVGAIWCLLGRPVNLAQVVQQAQRMASKPSAPAMAGGALHTPAPAATASTAPATQAAPVPQQAVQQELAIHGSAAPALSGPVSHQARAAMQCIACTHPVTAQDLFCTHCGHKQP